MKRLRVLISSHEFSPALGSECAVGWNIVTRIAKYHDVTVLCADGAPLWKNSYKNAIIRYIQRHGEIKGLKIVFICQPMQSLRYARINQKLQKITGGLFWQPLSFLGLDYWHRAALQKAKELGFKNFDVVHQLTPISFLKPGYLWTIGKPFFWGPVGGMAKVPEGFARYGGFKSRTFEWVRSQIIDCRLRSYAHRSIVKQAKRIWAVSVEERKIIDTVVKGKTALMIDTAPPNEIKGRLRRRRADEPLRVCWSGRHEPRKALPLLLHALSSLRGGNHVILDILGDGPERRNWQMLAAKLQLAQVNWLGHLPYPEALKAMDRAHVFIHTSYREAASMVILEALGWGLPVICHDACGMAVAVDASCGLKIALESPEKSIEGFRKAIVRLIEQHDLVEKLSKGALRRASLLSWDAKALEIAEAYNAQRQ